MSRLIERYSVYNRDYEKTFLPNHPHTDTATYVDTLVAPVHAFIRRFYAEGLLVKKSTPGHAGGCALEDIDDVHEPCHRCRIAMFLTYKSFKMYAD